MNSILTMDNTNIISDIFLNMPFLGSEYQNIAEELSKEKVSFNELRKDIGDELFYSLSDEDKRFIIKTEGIVDFGYKLTNKDIKRIEKSLRENYEY